jgi:hypothetical protein
MAAKKQPSRLFTCPICGNKGTALELTVFSKVTRKHYHAIGKCPQPTRPRQREIKESWPSLQHDAVLLIERYARAA